MRKKYWFLLLFIFVFGLFLLYENHLAPTSLSAQDKSVQSDASEYGAKPFGPYANLDIRTGVFNDGQAALWDLHLIDFFGIFGPPQRHRGHRPEQPINFSHITHVQKNKMECNYCHWSVTKAAYAAIPEEETCMGCHKLIMGTTPQQQEQIKKIADFYNRGEPIPWEKVHVMPNHVQFNHKRHVKAGVSCQECHGQVPNMAVVERVTSMKMGWCIECHRQRGSSIDCLTCHH